MTKCLKCDEFSVSKLREVIYTAAQKGETVNKADYPSTCPDCPFGQSDNEQGRPMTIPHRRTRMLRIAKRDYRVPRAFTLVELLVVILVLTLLASIMSPSIHAMEEEALRTKCKTRLQSLYSAAAAYGGANRTRVPLVHQGDFANMGRILNSGGEFAEKYMHQAWTSSDNYATMKKSDNAFQCPAALNHYDYHLKRKGTNYRLTGFALGLGGAWNAPGSPSRPPELPALYPRMTVIGGMVQAKGYHPGRVCMAMDWIWKTGREGTPLPDSYREDRGMSLRNHKRGANVLYGTGDVQWVTATSMLVHPDANLVPEKTYGFMQSGEGYTYVFAPDKKVVKPNDNGIRERFRDQGYNLSDGWGDSGPGVGVFW